MNVAELIALLQQHSPDLPVRMTIEDPEFGIVQHAAVDLYGAHRVVRSDVPYLELFG
jgi:hypothetical protein